MKRPRSVQPEHVNHGGVALSLEFRRVDQATLAHRARSRCHRRCREAGADIDLPYFLKRVVVKGRDCAVEPSEEYEAAGGPLGICIGDAVAISR
jgi:hypothetical protein